VTNKTVTTVNHENFSFESLSSKLQESVYMSRSDQSTLLATTTCRSFISSLCMCYQQFCFTFSLAWLLALLFSCIQYLNTENYKQFLINLEWTLMGSLWSILKPKYISLTITQSWMLMELNGTHLMSWNMLAFVFYIFFMERVLCCHFSFFMRSQSMKWAVMSFTDVYDLLLMTLFD